jgi:hypothetical protein
MIKKILIKMMIIAAMLVAMNYIYVIFFYERDLEQHSEVLDLVRDMPGSTDIVYIGESSNITVREDDTDKRYISDFVAEHFPELNLYDISWPASHAGIYKVLLSHISDDSDVKTVIVTLNLRSFNAQWIYSELETSLQKSMVLLKPYPPLVNRFLLSFKAYDIKTDQERTRQFIKKWEDDKLELPYPFPYENVREWDQWCALTGVKGPDGKRDQAKTELACHYIKAYGFQIDTLNNPRIADFNDIVDLARKRNWNLVFNLLAENTQKAEKLVGKDLIFLMKQNRDLLVDYFGRRGVVVVDNLNAVDDHQFIDQNWTTEHYAQHGRRIVAANVADSLIRFYPDQYRTVEYEKPVEDVFFNDCDDNKSWGQSQTLSEDVAYSGKYSSKTGQGNLYSLAFEYPISQLTANSLNSVDISLRVFQNHTDHDAKLVVQALGQGIEDFWHGTLISNLDKPAGSWYKFEESLFLPARIKDAEVIKIYVFNPTDRLVYIDDMQITFR